MYELSVTLHVHAADLLERADKLQRSKKGPHNKTKRENDLVLVRVDYCHISNLSVLIILAIVKEVNVFHR